MFGVTSIEIMKTRQNGRKLVLEILTKIFNFKIMKRQIAFLILILLSACASKKDITDSDYEKRLKEATIHFYKVQSFCACYKYAFKENNIYDLMSKEDLMGSFDMLANPVLLKTIDSLGKTEADKIKPEEYEDFEGKKRITERCLEFYISKRLDSIARAKIQ